MTVVEFDGQIFVGQHRGGISRYFVELIEQLRADASLGIEVSTPFRAVVNRHLVEADPGRYRIVSRGGAPLRALVDLPARRRAPRPQLRHYTSYEPGSLDRGSKVPGVTTVHDMIPELFPSEFPRGNPHRAKLDYVRASRGVVCVSETTRRDLTAVYGPLDLRVAVVPLGVGDEFRTPRPARVALPDRYLLFVGSRSGYKDFDVLVRATTIARDLGSMAVVCVGGGAFTSQERAAFADAGLAGRIEQLTVPDLDLPGVYARAAAFVFPSRYEGFGLPILEAMAAGTPVAAADTEVFREVAGDAAAFFPPGDADALAEVLVALVCDPARASAAATRGVAHAEGFTWHRTAELTAAFYREVTGE